MQQQGLQQQGLQQGLQQQGLQHFFCSTRNKFTGWISFPKQLAEQGFLSKQSYIIIFSFVAHICVITILLVPRFFCYLCLDL